LSYQIEFYRTVRGDEPALEYIRAQVKAHRAKIGRALRYLEDLGHLARRPMVDYLGAGLYELRVAAEGHQHRVLYFFHGKELIIVTSAFLKKDDAVPLSELVRAERYRADWLARFGGAA
jgi:phage-related protein